MAAQIAHHEVAQHRRQRPTGVAGGATGQGILGVPLAHERKPLQQIRGNR
ncbi:MAG: hypothetical protein U0470_07315 [Anaerolineae bacterium]